MYTYMYTWECTLCSFQISVVPLMLICFAGKCHSGSIDLLVCNSFRPWNYIFQGCTFEHGVWFASVIYVYMYLEFVCWCDCVSIIFYGYTFWWLSDVCMTYKVKEILSHVHIHIIQIICIIYIEYRWYFQRVTLWSTLCRTVSCLS